MIYLAIFLAILLTTFYAIWLGCRDDVNESNLDSKFKN